MGVNNGVAAGEKALSGQVRRHLSKYIVILLVVLAVIIAGGFYLRDPIERWVNPNYYAKHLRMGVWYMNQSLNDLAIEEFSKANKARPDGIEPQYYLGVIYSRQQKMEDAVGIFEKILTTAPDRIDVRYSLGNTYQRMGKMEQALEEYHRIAQREPGSYQVFNSVGVIQMKMGDYEKALTAFKHAINLKQDYYAAYFNLAKLYETQGKINLASEQYRYVQKNASKSPGTVSFAKAAEVRLAALKRPKGSDKRP